MLNILLVCGGKGTRISGVLGSTPKVLAPIGGYCFLDYMLAWIGSSFTHIEHRVILLTGIGHDDVSDYIEKRPSNIRLIREISPLGTLGAVFNALDSLDEGPILILNGDTIIDIDLSKPFKQFLSDSRKNLLLVKNHAIDSRYGGFNYIDNKLCKTDTAPQFVSMGAFYTDITKLCSIRTTTLSHSGQLMLDEDFLDKSPTLPYTLKYGTSFIDIGIPEDYQRAQTLIPQLIKI